MAKSKPDYNSNQDNIPAAAKSVYSDLKSNIDSEYPEIEEIREDIGTLKNDVVALTRHVKSNSGKHAADVRHFAEDQIGKVRKAGVDTLHKIEHRAAEKPGQTIALAFFAGLAASFFLGRRH